MTPPLSGIERSLKVKEKKYQGKIIDDELRSKTLEALKRIRVDFRRYPLASLVHYLDCKEIAERKESELSLYGSNKWFRKEYRESKEKRVFYEILKAIFPAYRKHLVHSSNHVLKHDESGEIKYPKGHSIFAATTQESQTSSLLKSQGSIGALPGGTTSSGYKPPRNLLIKDDELPVVDDVFGYSNYAKQLVKEIKKGGSLLDALLRTNNSYEGIIPIPSAPTYRLGEGLNVHEDKDFEFLIIVGSHNKGEKANRTLTSDMLSRAITEQYGNKCSSITVLDEPNEESIAATFIKVAKRANNKRLYIYYYGHGNADNLQKGVKEENIDKQGSLDFSFKLNPLGKDGLTEEKIKELYNRYLKDIEVITILDACHAGAGVASCNDKSLARTFSCLA